MVKTHNTKTLLPTYTCALYHARPRREEIHQPDVILELGALQPISFSLKVKKFPVIKMQLFVLFSMSWCCFQQINTICSSLPFGVDEEEMKEFHGNGRDTAADHQVGKQRAIKKRQEKTVSLCPWKEGPSALLSNICRMRSAARAQPGDVLKHSDTLRHSDLSFHHSWKPGASGTHNKDEPSGIDCGPSSQSLFFLSDGLCYQKHPFPSTGQSNGLSGYRFLPLFLNQRKESHS